MKKMSNTNTTETAKGTSDLKLKGDPDLWVLICKASSEKEGWMKSTKAMELGGGVVLQVTSEHRQPNGGIHSSEALEYLPGCKIEDVDGEKKIV